MIKKSTNLSKIVVLLLILTMLALIALSGTYAKYTTSMSGTGTATIAKWDIDFKNGENALSENFTIDLAKTMTSADNANAFIQPGSAGSFTITVTNNSDVAATISAEVTDQSATIFKNGQFTLTTVGNSAEEIAAKSSKEVTINWKWNYEADSEVETVDKADTKIGEESTKAAQTVCAIKLTATQVQPK